MTLSLPPHRTRGLWLLLVSLIVWLPLSAWLGPGLQPQRIYGKLGLALASSRGLDHVCAGGSLPLRFVVKNISTGLEVPLPVGEAMVTVTDGKGVFREFITNPAGQSVIRWPVQKTGLITLTATAKKANYVASPELRFQLNVIECQWLLGVSFQEEYGVVEDNSIKVGAMTNWKGELEADEPRGESLTTEVRLRGGQGMGAYRFYATDSLIPWDYSLTPPVEDAFNIDVHGTTDGQQVTLDLATQPVQYPKVLNLDIEDVISPDWEVTVQPPVATSGGNGLFLDSNHLSRITLPATGGSVHLDSGMSCYFYYPQRTKYSLTVWMTPMRGMTN